MRLASRSIVGLVALVVAASFDVLVAQDRWTDSVPTFDQLARRVLTVKVQVEALRARLGAPGLMSAESGEAAWRPIAWADSLAAIRAGFAPLGAAIGRLAASYRKNRHARGESLATELAGLADRARDSAERLARAPDGPTARTALTHLAAGLDALLQKIADGEACCKR